MVVAVLACSFVMVAGPVVLAATVDTTDQVQKGIDAAGGSGASATNLPALIKSIINILLYIAGAVAVVMLILGGIRYITSNGKQDQVTAAKNTIMYAIIGLIVVILAYAIVQFVVDNVK